jgi:hypothetical protein
LIDLPFLFLLLVLSNYAISRTASKENGPFAIFETVRDIATKNAPAWPIEPTSTDDDEWTRYDYEIKKYGHDKRKWDRSIIGTVAGALTCPYCLSWYTALLLVPTTGIYWYSPLLFFGVVGGTTFLLAFEGGK